MICKITAKVNMADVEEKGEIAITSQKNNEDKGNFQELSLSSYQETQSNTVQTDLSDDDTSNDEDNNGNTEEENNSEEKKKKQKDFWIISMVKAILGRSLFFIHVAVLTWRVVDVKDEPIYWLWLTALLPLLMETLVVVFIFNAHESKW